CEREQKRDQNSQIEGRVGRLEQAFNDLTSLGTQTQMTCDVVVNPMAGERAQDDDQGQDGQQEASAKDDDAVPEVDGRETPHEVLGNGPLISSPPPRSNPGQ